MNASERPFRRVRRCVSGRACRIAGARSWQTRPMSSTRRCADAWPTCFARLATGDRERLQLAADDGDARSAAIRAGTPMATWCYGQCVASMPSISARAEPPAPTESNPKIRNTRFPTPTRGSSKLDECSPRSCTVEARWPAAMPKQLWMGVLGSDRSALAGAAQSTTAASAPPLMKSSRLISSHPSAFPRPCWFQSTSRSRHRSITHLRYSGPSRSSK